jgi:hypothetical protein
MSVYTGNAYVPYGWSNTTEGAEIEAPKTPEQTQERGGRED